MADPSEGTWTNVQTIDALEHSRETRLSRKTADMKRFGDAFFERSKEELSQSTDATVPDDYPLAYGDQLQAITYNVKGGESTSLLTVDQKGDVYLPGAGPVGLAGLTPSQAEARLTGSVQARYPNLRVRLSMVKVRKIRVFVLGESRRPGGYLVNPGSTVLDALLASGGPTRAGSFRKIELQRNGRTLARFDLYKLLIQGKTDSPRLLDGDRIFIPLTGPEVTVVGEVVRPAIYELRGETTLRQVLSLAGGIKPEAYAPRAQIERLEANRTRRLLEVGLETVNPLQRGGLRLVPLAQGQGGTPVQNGDVVFILSVLDDLENGVYLDGSVKRPGWYAYRNGMKVSDILHRQDLQDGTFPGHAEIYRTTAPDQPIEVLGFELDRALAGDPQHNLALQVHDRLVVFDANTATFNRERVRIQGEVSRPGEYPRFANMTVRDLLYRAGGLTPEADLEAEIARQGPGRQLVRQKVDLDSVLDDPHSPSNVALQDLDLLVVRKSLRARRWPATVTLGGEVNRPGVYPVDPERDTLRSLIERAGGLTDLAYPKGAVFVRRSQDIIDPAQKSLATQVFSTLQTIARQFAAVDAARQAAQSNNGPASVNVTALNDEAVAIPRVIDHILSSGRIPLDLGQVMRSGQTDPGLRDGDVLYVPRQPTTVVVAGAVVVPSALLWREGASVNDYISHSGGFTKDAAQGEVVVFRVDGEVVRADQLGALEPGDVIMVPPEPIVAEPDAFERFLQVLQVGVNGLALWRLFR